MRAGGVQINLRIKLVVEELNSNVITSKAGPRPRLRLLALPGSVGVPPDFPSDFGRREARPLLDLNSFGDGG